VLDDPKAVVHETAFSVAGSSKGLMLRDDRWVYIQYGEDAAGGVELFDMQKDPLQFTNLAASPDHTATVAEWKSRLAAKLQSVRQNDLNR
jgi:iduronate 2-sulfatase